MRIKIFAKITGLAVCLAVITAEGGAQGLSIEANGGLQGTHYRLPGGQTQPLPGGSFGLTYTFPLSRVWGIRTGILGSVYRTQVSLHDGTVYTYGQVDDAGSAFQYNVKVTGYRETQQFFAATMPLLLHYQTGGAGAQWYFDGGGKLVFPFNSGIRVSAKQLSLSGYYPNFHINVSNLPQHGFGALNGWKSSSSTELRPAAALSAATGISFAITPRSRLYVGVYADYGVTDLRARGESLPLVSYSSAGINSVKVNGVSNMRGTGAVEVFSFGVQLRLGFGSAKPARKKKAAKVVAPAKTQVAAPAKDEVVAPAKNEVVAPAKEEVVAPAKTTAAPAPVSVATSDSLYEAAQRQMEINRSETAKTHRNIVFGIVGETNIQETQKAKLDEVVSILKQHPDIRVSVEGHFCDSVRQEENAQTALARAKAVARYLETKGISRRRLDIGYARTSDPVLSYDPAANYRNRRVVLVIIGSF